MRCTPMRRTLRFPIDPSTALVALVLVGTLLTAGNGFGQTFVDDKFRQLEEVLPTPTEVRTASGSPGPRYWQQRADYEIDVQIDDEKQHLIGRETITYHNNSPETLRYLWLQLDANIFAPGSDAQLSSTSPDLSDVSFRGLRRIIEGERFDGGVKITEVSDKNGAELAHTIVKTMMRVDLPGELEPGGQFVFNVAWNYAINDAKVIRARTGYEYFEEEDNYLYEMAQWFPRMVAFTDVNGWQHKQFLGRGEFTLEFGDYLVKITVPEDHIVASTGELENAGEVLTPRQRTRLERARQSYEEPVLIVTPDEAVANQKEKATGKKTWIYRAENVRDFAFATSRKFAWDAQACRIGERVVMAMSYFPNEGEPLWSRYSTHSVVHALEVYSRFAGDYPYPVAISVNGPVGGMEYPMICFNGPRPEEDGTYSKRTKYGLISVIIHEVGHNWFPMIINSDERQWTWMDEGLTTFVQYLAEQAWEEGYPSRRGEPKNMIEYMRSENQVPIMTNSESILQFGNNAYGKPATALNVLRETVLGRELFDFAFLEYCRRWSFKRPQPSDFFRSMEDASGIDLDWFWRGWFYSTDHTDIAIRGVRHYRLETGNPEIDKPAEKEERDAEPETIAEQRNRALPKRVDRFPELKDFYNEFDELDVTPQDMEKFAKKLEDLEDYEREMLELDREIYVVELENVGGLVMPVIFRVTYEDGSVEELRLPAEIWKKDSAVASRLFLARQPITDFELDPYLETADIDRSNNHFPPKPVESRFRLFKREKKKNPMQKQREAEEKAAEKKAADATAASDDRDV